MSYKSPARILRNVKRMTEFIENKLQRLTISKQSFIDINPVWNRLCVSKEVSVDIPPRKKSLTITPRVAFYSINPKEGTNISNKKARKL